MASDSVQHSYDKNILFQILGNLSRVCEHKCSQAVLVAMQGHHTQLPNRHCMYMNFRDRVNHVRAIEYM